MRMPGAYHFLYTKKCGYVQKKCTLRSVVEKSALWLWHFMVHSQLSCVDVYTKCADDLLSFEVLYARCTLRFLIRDAKGKVIFACK